MEPLRVRPATEADVDALVGVYEQVAAEGRWIGAEAPVDGDSERETRLKAIGSDTALVLVAEANGAPIGELFLSGPKGVAWLGMEIVDEWRGHGVGSALMEHAIEWARGRAFDKVALFVWPHNEAAIALYEKFGFRREGYHPSHFRRRNGDAWDAISMGLVLGP